MRTSIRLAVLFTSFCLSWSTTIVAKDGSATAQKAAPVVAKKKYHYNPWKDDPNYRFYISGKVALAPELDPAGKGFREVYIELYTTAAEDSKPYAWTKYVLAADPTGTFLDFKVTEKNIHFTSLYPDRNIAMPTLKIRLTKYGLMGAESPGDMVGILQGVKIGDDELIVTVNRVAAPVFAH